MATEKGRIIDFCDKDSAIGLAQVEGCSAAEFLDNDISDPESGTYSPGCTVQTSPQRLPRKKNAWRNISGDGGSMERGSTESKAAESSISVNFSEDRLDWRATLFNVGVIGKSGSGKSSFINAIRGLEACVIETSAVIKSYRHPTIPNLVFWDLPESVTNTIKKRKTYLPQWNIHRYDAFLIMTASRFDDTDICLGQKLQENNKTVYFVRTKTGIDVKNDKYDKGPDQNSAAQIKKLKEYLMSSIMAALQYRLSTEVLLFLIDSHQRNKFDFSELEQDLLLLAKTRFESSLHSKTPSFQLHKFASAKKLIDKPVAATLDGDESGCPFSSNNKDGRYDSSCCDDDTNKCTFPLTERDRIYAWIENSCPEISCLFFHANKLEVILKYDGVRDWSKEELAQEMGVDVSMIEVFKATRKPTVTLTAGEPGSKLGDGEGGGDRSIGAYTARDPVTSSTGQSKYALLSGHGLTEGDILYTAPGQPIGSIEKVIVINQVQEEISSIALMKVEVDCALRNVVKDADDKLRLLADQCRELSLHSSELVHKFQEGAGRDVGNTSRIRSFADFPLYNECIGIPGPIHYQNESGVLITRVPQSSNGGMDKIIVHSLGMLEAIIAIHVPDRDIKYSVAQPMKRILEAINRTPGYESLKLCSDHHLVS